MPTSKKRINISVADKLYRELQQLSSKREQSVAGVSLALLEEALENQEDRHFSRVADERMSRKEKRVPHAVAWK